MSKIPQNLETRGELSLSQIGSKHKVQHGEIWTSSLGQGSPAVIFLSGAGTVGLDYYELQQGIAKETFALIYDRLGIGLSSDCYLPRTSRQVIDELHELLTISQVPKPYLLVGHSLGGLYARHYAIIYKEEVCGLVLLDPAHEDYDRFMPEELNRLRKAPTNNAKKKVSIPQHRNSPSLLIRIANTQLGKTLLELVPLVAKYRKIYLKLFSEELSGWTEDLKNPLIQAHASVKWLLRGSRESLNVYDLYAEIRQAGQTPDIPITILNSMEIDGFRRVVLAGETAELIDQEIAGKRKLYQDYLSLVTEGKLIDLNAGHVNLHFRHPQAVVSAIREMVDKWRRT